MRSKKNVRKLVALCGAFCFALSVFTSPVAAMPVQAGFGDEMIQPYSDKIEWRWKVEDNKLYKRLFNYSTISWVGDWIYVRDLP